MVNNLVFIVRYIHINAVMINLILEIRKFRYTNSFPTKSCNTTVAAQAAVAFGSNNNSSNQQLLQLLQQQQHVVHQHQHQPLPADEPILKQI